MQSKLNLWNFFKRPILRQLMEIATVKPQFLVYVIGIISLFLFITSSRGVNIPAPLKIIASLCIGGTSSILVKEYFRLIPVKYKLPYKSHLKNKSIFNHNKHLDVEKKIAELKNNNGFPIFILYDHNPKMRGNIIARIFGRELLEAFDRYYNLLPKAINALYVSESIKHFTLPFYDINSPLYHKTIYDYLDSQYTKMKFRFPNYVEEEIMGLIDEANKWIANENKTSVIHRSKITALDIKKLITLPDMAKLSACSAAIRKYRLGIELFRNFDFPSFGVLEKLTFAFISKIYNEDQSKPQAVASVTFLPFAAGVSLANSNGLVLTINDAYTTSTMRWKENGIPMILFTREIMRNCSTIAEVKSFCQKNFPSTPHSLTIMDKHENGGIFQMLPSDQPEVNFSFRPLVKDSISVTNHHYNKNGKVIKRSINWHDSVSRGKKLSELLLKKYPSSNILDVVGNSATSHSLIFTSSKSGELTLKVRSRNYHAASLNNGTKINLTRLFENLNSRTLRL